MRNDAIVITRGRLGQWGSLIGGVGLLVGVVGFIWQGGLTGYILAALVIGVLGILLWALMTPNEFWGFVTGRQVRHGTVAIFSSLLLVGIVALAYILVQRAVLTLDMTEGRRFTLSSETREVLSRIRSPIRITGFYTPSDLNQREVDDQFFRLYEDASGGRVTRQYVDPLEQPGIAGRFAQRFGLIAFPDNLFLSFVNADGTIDFETTTRIPRTATQERDMTQAINRLLLTGAFTVYFETSHGEFDPIDNGQQGLSIINNELRGNGMITQPLDLMQLAAAGGQIPADASVVVMAGPTTPLSDAEIAVLDAYLKRGGALFIMTGPLFSEERFLAEDSVFNRYLWDNFGLRALDAVVVDPAASGATALDIVSAAVFPEIEIGANLNVEGNPDTATLFRLARPIEVNTAPPVPNGQIIATSPQGYGERNLAALRETDTYTFDAREDIPGPLTTVAWAQNPDTKAKILLVGDNDFATNGQAISPTGNRILFMDGLAWLTGFSDQVRFQPQAFATGLPLLFIDGPTLDLIGFLTVILLPGLVLVSGLGIWLRRVRR